MSKVAILLTDYSEKLAPVFGDFSEQTIVLLRDAGLKEEIDVYDAIQSEFPSEALLKDIKAIWITGSEADAFSNELWVLSLLDFIRSTRSRFPKIRFIGVCFGHQIIGRSLGAEVARNSTGFEVGAHKIHLSSDPEVQEFFEGEHEFSMMELHQDIVTKVPEGFKNIGTTRSTGIQGLYKKHQVLTFQGHPEFKRGIVETVTNSLHAEGKIDERVYQNAIDSLKLANDGPKVARFIIKFINESS